MQLPLIRTKLFPDLYSTSYRWLKIATILCLLAILAAWQFKDVHPYELLVSFSPQYLYFGILSAVIFFYKRAFLWSCLALIIVAFQLAWSIPYIVTSLKPTQLVMSSNNLVIWSGNVLGSNTQHGQYIDQILAAQPDVVALVEVTDTWAAALETLRKDYPYVVVSPQKDNFGMALYSKLPIVSEQILNLSEIPRPTIVVQLQRKDGAPVTAIVVHPVPPVTEFLAQQRDQYLVHLSQTVRDLRTPVVILGDINITPWAAQLQKLLLEGHLHDAHDIFGLLPSWPALFPVFFRIPIDYVLYSDGIKVTQLSTVNAAGSDHRALLAKIQ